MTQEQKDALSKFVLSTSDALQKLFPLIDEVKTLAEIMNEMTYKTQKLAKVVSILIEHTPDDVRNKVNIILNEK